MMRDDQEKQTERTVLEARTVSSAISTKQRKHLTRFFFELRIVHEFELISQKISKTENSFRGTENVPEMVFV